MTKKELLQLLAAAYVVNKLNSGDKDAKILVSKPIYAKCQFHGIKEYNGIPIKAF